MRQLGGLSRFWHDRGGNFAMMTGAVVAMLGLAVGFAVNTAQLYNIKSRLGQALDAAVTSTARDLTTGKTDPKDARASVEAFLKANMESEVAAADSVVLDSLVVDQTAKTVEAAAHIDVGLFFPLFYSGDSARVRNASAALYSDKQIEVAMMLDVTGSMAGQKIKDLKTAANNAIDAFLAGQDAASPRVRVAIVPYADAVNTGTLANVVHVEKKFTTGEPPKLTDPADVSTAPDACATERKGSQQFTDAGPETAMVNRDYRLGFCPSASLKPLTATAKTLKDTVGSFKADGFTGGHTGIQWTWYMLSPEWSGVLPKASRPAAHNPKKVAKYAILMTDGEFNTAFAGVPEDGNPRGQAKLSRGNAETLCGKMRDDGIEIFTIGFMLEEAGAKSTMKKCASPDTGSIKHYYQTSSGSELNQAFLDIARNIERLAVTK